MNFRTFSPIGIHLLVALSFAPGVQAQEAAPEPPDVGEAPSSPPPEPDDVTTELEATAAPEVVADADADVDASTDDSASTDDEAVSEAANRSEAVEPAAEASEVPLDDVSDSVEVAPAAPEDVEARTEEVARTALADAPSDKPSLLPLDVHTKTWSRFEFREGYDDLGVERGRWQEGDHIAFRARLGFETNPLRLTKDFTGTVNFTPQASGGWGTSGASGTVGEANLGIYEGYFRFEGKRVAFKAGRFEMDYGDAMVIGNLDWNEAGRAFDGAHVHYEMNHGFVDFFGTLTAEGYPDDTDPVFAGDRWFWGAYSNIGGYVANDLILDLYFLGLSDPSTQSADGQFTRDGATRFTFGTRAKQTLDFFDYRFEGGLQFGQTSGAIDSDLGHPPVTADIAAQSVLAYNLELELGFSLSVVRFGFGGSVTSGDDSDTAQIESWDELYPTTHKWFGLMDVFGQRTNAASGFFKIDASVTKSLSAMLRGHVLARMEEGGLGRTGDDGYAGFELNAQLLQKIGKWGSARGLYGLYLPNEGHYATGDAAHYVAVQAGISY